MKASLQAKNLKPKICLVLKVKTDVLYWNNSRALIVRGLWSMESGAIKLINIIYLFIYLFIYLLM